MTQVLLVLLGCYLLLCLLVYALQDSLLFPGSGAGAGAPDRLPNVRIERLQAADGTGFRIAVAHPAGDPRGVLLCFLGNGESLQSGVHRAAMYAEYGCIAVAMEYPGYGASEGRPGYQPILAAAAAAGRWCVALAGERQLPLVLVGQSLGSFPATHLAAQGVGERLLLVSPPSTIAAAGQRHFPFLPVGLLLRHPFDNLAVAPSIRVPTLVIHGERDQVVGIAMGRAVAAAIPGARFHQVPGAGHNDLPLQRRGPLGDRIAGHLFR